EIEFYDPENINYSASSIGLINKYIRGYREGEISIWTGSNGSGKSTILLQEAIKAVDDDMNTVIINGENIPSKTKKTIGLQIADIDYIESKV
ncbi:AAA family ATPase, partial [Streptomyces sp. P17]|uniref:AAA family ATPase n=1 Tax=Streptomyces sp. P17 TaxID=3074716 RepID=UPI0028F45FAF